MTFKILGEGNFIVPCTYAEKPPEPFLNGPCHQSEWELRTLYILEVMVNDPDYIYSKRVVYVDKDEGWFTIYWGEGYDQQGRLWRANGTGAVAQKSYKEESLKDISHRNLFGWVYMNCQTKHYTVLSGDPIFELYDIDKIHSIKGLLKMAR